jgi:predicted nucleic acid-binding protein
VDASVAAKWLLRDEAHMAEADALLERCANRALTLYAPEQIDVEIGAALRRAVLNGRLGPTEAERSMANWMGPLRSGLRLARNADLLPSALPRSLALGVTLFDALYVVLAEQIGIPLVVADQRLVRSSVAALPGVLSLTDLGDERQE